MVNGCQFSDIPSPNEFAALFHAPVWLEAAAMLCKRHRISFGSLARAEHGENIVIFIDDRFVLKIYTPKKNGFQREQTGLRFVRGKTALKFPEILFQGELEEFRYLITTRIPGRLLSRSEWLKLERSAQDRVLAELSDGLKELHSADPGVIEFDWDQFIERQMNTVIERQLSEGGNPEWIVSLPRFLERYLPLLPTDMASGSFMHGDVHFGNLRINNDADCPRITGIFDLADSLKGFHEYEFVAIGVLMIQGQGELQREFFRRYGYLDYEINEELRRRLMLLTILYEHSSLRRYAERLGPGSELLTLEELERAIWNFC